MVDSRLLTAGIVVVIAVVALLVGFSFIYGSSDEADAEPDTVEEFTPPDPETMPGVLDAEHNEFAGFEDVAVEAGLEYEVVDHGIPLVVDNSGAYVVDFTNDGYEDLLLIGGEKPTLFENIGGEYVPAQEFDHPHAMVAHFFDYNNNGYQDLAIADFGGSLVLYENVGGEFVERPDAFPSVSLSYPTTMTAADVTDNGCLDVYVGNWAGPFSQQPMSLEEFATVAAHHPEARPSTETGGANALYAGDCESFEEIAEDAGVAGSEYTLAVSAADVTGNGHVDLHVGNDFTADHLYENRGGGDFEKIDMGPASDRNAMSSAVADLTGDHRLDIFVTNVYFHDPPPGTDLVQVVNVPLPYGNNLFANQGGGEFVDVAPDHGLHAGSWGWSATVADYTNDGHLDVIHASMYVNPTIVADQPETFRTLQAWKGTGTSWEKVDGVELGFSNHNLRGVVRIDYQNDGVLDLVAVDNPSTPAVSGTERGGNSTHLYENTLDSEDSLQLWIRNDHGIDRNAGVYVETDERTIYREANSRGDLLSQDSRLIHVGTKNEVVERVIVQWPDGTENIYDDLSSGNRYILTPDGFEVID